jgi:hypothetical protein
VIRGPRAASVIGCAGGGVVSSTAVARWSDLRGRMFAVAMDDDRQSGAAGAHCCIARGTRGAHGRSEVSRRGWIRRSCSRRRTPSAIPAYASEGQPKHGCGCVSQSVADRDGERVVSRALSETTVSIEVRVVDRDVVGLATDLAKSERLFASLIGAYLT